MLRSRDEDDEDDRGILDVGYSAYVEADESTTTDPDLSLRDVRRGFAERFMWCGVVKIHGV
jgi:hypothetical protein